MPADQFIVRDERIEDYGVDLSIEILENGNVTNFRAQVQLKGSEAIVAKNDGNYNLPVKTANLNYLLNNPISIYILYIAKKDEFRFVWAWDEFKRIEEKDIDWRKNRSITLRFSEILNQENLKIIKNRILNQSITYRALNETVFLAKSPTVSFEFDVTTFEVNDAQKIKELLLAQGLSYAVEGYSQQILDKIHLLERDDRKLPSILILKAVAECEKRQFRRAKETIAIIESNEAQLAEDEKLIVDFVRVHCNFEMGIIGHEEFISTLEKISAIKTRVHPYDFRLSYLNTRANGESDIDIRENLVKELRAEIQKTANFA